jgi:hypothetical protein
MAAVTSTFKDPSDSFVWWIEGDKLAIATTLGDGGTSETAEGKFKAASIGSATDYISNGLLISYYAEPDKIDNSSGTGISATIDLENVLQPLLIDYVKGHLLIDAAAKASDPQRAALKMQMGQQFLALYKEGIRRHGMKKNDKTGGTRAIVPANLR